jgi:hypothetical protein
MLWFRILSIITDVLAFLQTLTLRSAPALHTLFVNTILPSFSIQDALVRERSVCALGLFCLLDAALAAEYFHLFFQAIRNDCAAVQLHSMRVAADLALVLPDIEQRQREHWNAVKAKMQNEKKEDADADEPAASAAATSEPDVTERIVSLDELAELLASRALGFLESEEFSCDALTGDESALYPIVYTSLEALLKLLVFRRVRPPVALLARLLLVYFNPAYKPLTQIIQRISVFFPNYAISDAFCAADGAASTTGGTHRQAIAACVVPVLAAITSAARGVLPDATEVQQALCHVNTSDVCNYFAYLLAIPAPAQQPQPELRAVDSAAAAAGDAGQADGKSSENEAAAPELTDALPDATPHELLAIDLAHHVLAGLPAPLTKALVQMLSILSFSAAHPAVLVHLCSLLNECAPKISDRVTRRTLDKLLSKLSALIPAQTAAAYAIPSHVQHLLQKVRALRVQAILMQIGADGEDTFGSAPPTEAAASSAVTASTSRSGKGVKAKPKGRTLASKKKRSKASSSSSEPEEDEAERSDEEEEYSQKKKRCNGKPTASAAAATAAESQGARRTSRVSKEAAIRKLAESQIAMNAADAILEASEDDDEENAERAAESGSDDERENRAPAANARAAPTKAAPSKAVRSAAQKHTAAMTTTKQKTSKAKTAK